MSESSVNFRSALRGYDPAQVDHHMHQLAQAAASHWQESAELTRQINELKTANGRLRSEVEDHARRTRALQEQQREAAAPTYTGLGAHIGSLLTLVDNEVHQLRTRAQADAAKSRALADEEAGAIRQDADTYARQIRSAAVDECAQLREEARQLAETHLEEADHRAESLLEEARRQAESLLEDADRQAMARQDADRQAMARREEAETAYERARASAAAAAVDFETTLATRREASALEFAAQVTAAEHQLAAVRLRSEQTRSDSERAQKEVAAKIAQQLEQATARARSLVDEAKSKAERIRDSSERELAAATQRRDTIYAQISNVRHDLAALGDGSGVQPIRIAEAAADQNQGADGQDHVVVGLPSDVQAS